MSLECGNCASCKRKARAERIKLLSIWTIIVGVNVVMWPQIIYSKMHPAPKTAQELALDAKINQLGDNLDQAQTAYDAAIEERDGPPNEDHENGDGS